MMNGSVVDCVESKLKNAFDGGHSGKTLIKT